MKTPLFLSPSAFNLYCSDIDLYAKRYIIEPGQPRDPQTTQMAVGSAFDVFVKNELARCKLPAHHVQLGGAFHLETLFNKQVEEEHREFAWEGGGWLFLKYKDHGGFDALLAEMEGCLEGPVFEDELVQRLTMPDGVEVPLKGFPDCYYRHKQGKLVLLDWKCNGYKAKTRRSPYKYYVISRPKLTWYKECVPEVKDGLLVQLSKPFEEVDRGWATQLSIYSWLLGEPIAKAENYVQIDQILPDPVDDKPECRIITYRGMVSIEFQERLAKKLSEVWTAISSGHIYDTLTPEEGLIRLKKLEKMALMIMDNNPIINLIKLAKGA